ncbi:MAG TPA: HAMP domain-containing sensor histidine kinase [Mycobacterium sp.]|nr:HAMP domain-containing sensor histidine kinase [Mycobacterium sp.]
MSSSRRRNPRVRPRIFASLRARLLVGQVALLAGVCIGIAGVTLLALHQYLVGELDEQLMHIAQRSAMMERRMPPPPPRWPGEPIPMPRPGPGPDFLDAPGQPVGMVAAVIDEGRVTRAGALNRGADRTSVSPTATVQLAQVDRMGHPVTRTLDGLGRYRLMSAPGRSPDTMVVIGLSMTNVTRTLARVATIFAVVTALALAVAIAAGVLIIRRALVPLNRVAAAAADVAELPLDRGEVALPVRVPATDTDPDTEVGRLGMAVNRMLDHITAALASRQASETRVRQFVADASHELRTPLAAIRGYTELAQRHRDQLPADVTHAMNRVESEADRMTRLVEDLLLLARLDSGRPLEQTTVDLSRLCADAIGDAHVAGPGQRWNLELPDDPVLVTGDEARLYQVVANLLTNARVHTPAGTTVTLAVRTDEHAAVLTVTDDGPGIPDALVLEVFGRFVRGDASRSRREGSTGLGLAIAAAVVRAHGGEISVDSVPGRTVFTVRLPGQRRERE